MALIKYTSYSSLSQRKVESLGFWGTFLFHLSLLSSCLLCKRGGGLFIEVWVM